MIIKSKADLRSYAVRRTRLSEVLTGERAVILDSESPVLDRRMMVLGLIDGVEVEVETRGRRGDLVLVSGGERFHVLSHYAEKIWVEPVSTPA